MRLTRREKILLIAVGFALSAYLVYSFVVVPQLAQISEREAELANLQALEVRVNRAPGDLQALILEHESISLDISDLATGYFTSLNHQEELILLLHELVSLPGLTDPSLALSQLAPSSFGGAPAQLQTISLSLEGSYDTIWDFLRSVWGFEKRILLNNLTLSASENDMFSAGTNLQMYDISQTSQVFESLVIWFNRPDFVKENPFSPLPGQPFVGRRYLLASDSLDLLRRYVPFVDIRGHWAEDEINELGEKRVVFGDSANRFYPNSPISRGELVVLLDSHFQWPVPDEPIDLTVFPDYVDIGSYQSAMARAVFKGFLNEYIVGYGDGYLRPNNPVTYAEFNDIMGRILELPGYSWQVPAQELLNQTGHRSVGLADSGAQMTRAEAVYYVARLLR